MIYKELVEGVKIPVLGIGTWKIGGDYYPDYSRDKEEIKSIKFAIKLGMTHIDTAEIYANGHAEELVGKAIKSFKRKEIFITTKVSGDHLKYEQVISSAEGSLKRLGIKYIDLYLIHWPSTKVPLKETMEAMDHLVEEKKVRFIGVSNFSVKEIKEAQKYSKNKIVSNQIEYNLLVRNRGEFNVNMESEIIPYCQQNNIIIIAYRPLAYGKLVSFKNKLLDELCEKYKKTRAQIALNWLISKPGIVAIPKASKIEHIKENLGAIGWSLSEEDIRKLDTEFPST